MKTTKAIGTALLLVLFLFGAPPAQTDTLGGRFILGDPMAADPVSASGYWTNLTTGDVDNDGYPDIAAAHGYRRAGLYLHNGARSFAAELVFSETWWRISANIGASSIALGDLDRDGNLDMVIPIYGNHFQEHMVQLYKGHGDGWKFTPNLANEGRPDDFGVIRWAKHGTLRLHQTLSGTSRAPRLRRRG